MVFLFAFLDTPEIPVFFLSPLSLNSKLTQTPLQPPPSKSELTQMLLCLTHATQALLY